MQRRRLIRWLSYFRTASFFSKWQVFNQNIMKQTYLTVIGASTAGLPSTSTAAKRGQKVALVEKAERIGGTLHVKAGHMSGGVYVV